MAAITCRPRRASTVSKIKNAQEAHEAIRPTDVARTPAEVSRYLSNDQRRLYELVWKRAVASQMASAELDQVSVDVIDGKGQVLRANGSIVAFDGFLKLYHEDQDDPTEEDDSRMLPPMRERDPLRRGQVDAVAAFHPAAAALLGSQPGEEDGGARHWPAIHVCLDPVGVAGPRTMSGWTSGASSRRTAAGWSLPSW